MATTVARAESAAPVDAPHRLAPGAARRACSALPPLPPPCGGPGVRQTAVGRRAARRAPASRAYQPLRLEPPSSSDDEALNAASRRGVLSALLAHTRSELAHFAPLDEAWEQALAAAASPTASPRAELAPEPLAAREQAAAPDRLAPQHLPPAPPAWLTPGLMARVGSLARSQAAGGGALLVREAAHTSSESERLAALERNLRSVEAQLAEKERELAAMVASLEAAVAARVAAGSPAVLAEEVQEEREPAPATPTVAEAAQAERVAAEVAAASALAAAAAAQEAQDAADLAQCLTADALAEERADAARAERWLDSRAAAWAPIDALDPGWACAAGYPDQTALDVPDRVVDLDDTVSMPAMALATQHSSEDVDVNAPTIDAHVLHHDALLAQLPLADSHAAVDTQRVEEAIGVDQAVSDLAEHEAAMELLVHALFQEAADQLAELTAGEDVAEEEIEAEAVGAEAIDAEEEVAVVEGEDAEGLANAAKDDQFTLVFPPGGAPDVGPIPLALPVAAAALDASAAWSAAAKESPNDEATRDRDETPFRATVAATTALAAAAAAAAIVGGGDLDPSMLIARTPAQVQSAWAQAGATAETARAALRGIAAPLVTAPALRGNATAPPPPEVAADASAVAAAASTLSPPPPPPPLPPAASLTGGDAFDGGGTSGGDSATLGVAEEVAVAAAHAAPSVVGGGFGLLRDLVAAPGALGGALLSAALLSVAVERRSADAVKARAAAAAAAAQQDKQQASAQRGQSVVLRAGAAVAAAGIGAAAAALLGGGTVVAPLSSPPPSTPALGVPPAALVTARSAAQRDPAALDAALVAARDEAARAAAAQLLLTAPPLVDAPPPPLAPQPQMQQLQPRHAPGGGTVLLAGGALLSALGGREALRRLGGPQREDADGLPEERHQAATQEAAQEFKRRFVLSRGALRAEKEAAEATAAAVLETLHAQQAAAALTLTQRTRPAAAATSELTRAEVDAAMLSALRSGWRLITHTVAAVMRPDDHAAEETEAALAMAGTPEVPPEARMVSDVQPTGEALDEDAPPDSDAARELELPPVAASAERTERTSSLALAAPAQHSLAEQLSAARRAARLAARPAEPDAARTGGGDGGGGALEMLRRAEVAAQQAASLYSHTLAGMQRAEVVDVPAMDPLAHAVAVSARAAVAVLPEQFPPLLPVADRTSFSAGVVVDVDHHEVIAHSMPSPPEPAAAVMCLDEVLFTKKQLQRQEMPAVLFTNAQLTSHDADAVAATIFVASPVVVLRSRKDALAAAARAEHKASRRAAAARAATPAPLRRDSARSEHWSEALRGVCESAALRQHEAHAAALDADAKRHADATRRADEAHRAAMRRLRRHDDGGREEAQRAARWLAKVEQQATGGALSDGYDGDSPREGGLRRRERAAQRWEGPGGAR